MRQAESALHPKIYSLSLTQWYLSSPIPPRTLRFILPEYILWIYPAGSLSLATSLRSFCIKKVSELTRQPNPRFARGDSPRPLRGV